MPVYSVDAINELGADVVVPQPDGAVRWLAENAGSVEAATFLPSVATIEVCRDKGEAQRAWWDASLTPGALALGGKVSRDLLLAKGLFGYPFWLRARYGAGARCALKVEDLRQADLWVRFWRLRGVEDFIAEEYLPGRDLAWTGIYWRGELVTSFARERLEYLYPHLTPTGLTGTPTRARIVHDEKVNAVAELAVSVIDVGPHGIMSVDLKEDSEGTPCPTEINAGRGFTTLGLWSLYRNSCNFLDFAAEIAVRDEPIGKAAGRDPLPEGLTLHRHIDAGHRFVLERASVPA